MKPENLLEISGLNVVFKTRSGSIHASQDVNLSIKRGEISVLVGETGSGKSVIGYSVLKLLPSSTDISGVISYNGTDILKLSENEFSKMRGHEISLIPQNPSASLDPIMKCGKQIEESLTIGGVEKKYLDYESIRLLSSLRFEKPEVISRSFPHELSGGMRQRVTTGIALASGPRLLVADEPTKGLDYSTRKSSIEMFLHLKNERNDTQMLITHDLDLAQGIGDSISVLYSGEIIESGPACEVFSDPLHPYTKGLIDALPRNGMIPMPGACPGLLNLPDGCYFHDRCPHPCIKGEKIHPSLDNLSDNRRVRCHQFCV